MKRSNIHSSFKKGDKRNCENYGGISVTCWIGILYEVDNKEKDRSGNNTLKEQRGFSSRRSCTDNVFCIQLIFLKKDHCIEPV